MSDLPVRIPEIVHELHRLSVAFGETHDESDMETSDTLYNAALAIEILYRAVRSIAKFDSVGNAARLVVEEALRMDSLQ